MRVSIRKDDHGFHPKAFECKPYLNGKELKNCFTADEEKGEAHCYAEDENGRPYIDPQNPDCLKEVVLTGDVKIVVPLGFLET